MYFWKIDNLKQDLIQNTLSEKEQFKYLLASTFVYSLAIIPFMDRNVWDIYLYTILGVISVLGTYYVYKMNGGSNGKNILQRYMSLSLVIGIRWIVFVVLPVAIILGLVSGLFLTVIPTGTTLYDVVFFNLTVLIYFWSLGKHIREVALKTHN